MNDLKDIFPSLNQDQLKQAEIIQNTFDDAQRDACKLLDSKEIDLSSYHDLMSETFQNMIDSFQTLLGDEGFEKLFEMSVSDAKLTSLAIVEKSKKLHQDG